MPSEGTEIYVCKGCESVVIVIISVGNPENCQTLCCIGMGHASQHTCHHNQTLPHFVSRISTTGNDNLSIYANSLHNIAYANTISLCIF
uniref:Uncharacterized protein n=1 Tax=Anguilla anguilla TaxID=7936 RepID=A0A0E9R1M9_ANGAN